MSSDFEKSRRLVSQLLIAILRQENYSVWIKRLLVQILKGDSRPPHGRREGGNQVDELRRLTAGLRRSSWTRAGEELERAASNGIWFLSLLDGEYPAPLRETVEPPVVLFGKGQPAWRTTEEWRESVDGDVFSGVPFLALVGTRRASPYGLRAARRIAGAAAERGAVIVSGLAVGVDAAAHEAAVRVARSGSGQRWSAGVAVLGSGILNVYPRENLYLAQAILEHGGVLLSEYGVGTAPRAHFFPERNRIISGLSEAVLVVEAPLRSGAMITARLALEGGREVAACPGPIDSEQSEGPHALLRDGAQLVASFEDLAQISERFRRRCMESRGGSRHGFMEVEEGSRRGAHVRRCCVVELIRSNSELGEADKVLAYRLIEWLARTGEGGIDEICTELAVEPSRLLPIASWLEIGGAVNLSPGGTVQLAEFVDTQALSSALCGVTGASALCEG